MPGPLTKTPEYIDALTEKLPTPIRGLLELAFGGPADIPLPPAIGMAAGKVKGFVLPGGKAVSKDAGGVMRLWEGPQAKRATEVMTGTTATRRMAKEPAPPSIRAVEELRGLAGGTGQSPATAAHSSGATSAERASRAGSSVRGKLNPSMVKMIRQSAAEGKAAKDIAAEWGISEPSAREIIRRLSWAWVPD